MSKVVPQEESSPPRHLPFQHSLRTLFVDMLVLGIVLSYWTVYGLAIGLPIGALTFLVLVSIARAKRRWRELSRWQRVWAGIEGGVFSSLLVAFVLGVATSPSFARERSARSLQRGLSSDERFSSVRVEYREFKLRFLDVQGGSAI
jgi:hypothetical protein